MMLKIFFSIGLLGVLAASPATASETCARLRDRYEFNDTFWSRCASRLEHTAMCGELLSNGEEAGPEWKARGCREEAARKWLDSVGNPVAGPANETEASSTDQPPAKVEETRESRVRVWGPGGTRAQSWSRTTVEGDDDEVTVRSRTRVWTYTPSYSYRIVPRYTNTPHAGRPGYHLGLAPCYDCYR
jgi:hypothetical protein